MEKKKHIIDPDKLAKTWGIPWKHDLLYDELKYRDPEGNLHIEDENTYSFYMPNGNVIGFSNYNPTRIVISSCGENIIFFNKITKVYYFFKFEKVFIAEYISGEDIVEIKISSDGSYELRIGGPTRLDYIERYSSFYTDRESEV